MGNAYGEPASVLEAPESLDGTSVLRTVFGEGVNATIAERLEQTSEIRDEIDGLKAAFLNLDQQRP